MPTAPDPVRPAPIDTRGPRFTATMTTVLLAAAVFLALVGTSTAGGPSLAQRATDPATVFVGIVALLFAWGFLAPGSAPWGVMFRSLVRPRLGPVTDVEDPRPPRFAQAVGFVVVVSGMLLHILAVPWALVIASAAAFLAAFLNAVFGFCLGCELYLLLSRARLIRPRGGLAT